MADKMSNSLKSTRLILCQCLFKKLIFFLPLQEIYTCHLKTSCTFGLNCFIRILDLIKFDSIINLFEINQTLLLENSTFPKLLVELVKHFKTDIFKRLECTCSQKVVAVNEIN